MVDLGTDGSEMEPNMANRVNIPTYVASPQLLCYFRRFFLFLFDNHLAVENEGADINLNQLWMNFFRTKNFMKARYSNFPIFTKNTVKGSSKNSETIIKQNFQQNSTLFINHSNAAITSLYFSYRAFYPTLQNTL